MNKLKYLLFSLIALTFVGCSDEIDSLVQPDAGIARYRFAAEIGEAQLSRVSMDPDDEKLFLHWEEGDVVELEADGSGLKYNFVAKKYVCRDDGTIEAFTSSTVLADGDITIIFFEYSGSDVIENAAHFSGTATCRPVDLGSEKLRQAEPDDASHLRHCEFLTARLNDIDLTTTVSAWTTSGLKQPVVFEHAGEYAYLKIRTNGFRYPIGGGGMLYFYDMDEESTDDNYRYSEYFMPLDSIRFGIVGSTFIAVPEKGVTSGYTSEYFDTYTEQYLNALEIVCDFYLPIKPITIQAGHYLAVVVQCGSSHDLYVFEKKVPFKTELSAGKFYILDYTDHQPEYAMRLIDNLSYLRSTFLGQNFEGKGATAPHYNLKGNEVSLTNNTPHNSNRFSQQDVADCGADYLTADEVKEMRNNHGAFYLPSSQTIYNWDGRSGGSEMVSIRAIKKSYWERWDEVDGDGGAWKFYDSSGSATDSSGLPYTDGTRKIILTDTLTINKYLPTKDYMKKLTKGVINDTSSYHLGKFNNCYEYVLKDKFDPVIKHRKTSLLWRAPYGRDLILPLTSYDNGLVKIYYASVKVSDNVVTITCNSTGHKIALPLLLEYYEDRVARSTRFDGAGATSGTWKQRVLSSSLTIIRLFGCRSIRSFGGNNPTYFQTVSAGVNYSGNFSTKFSYSSNFDIALPVLPVFRWHKVSAYNRLIRWD